MTKEILEALDAGGRDSRLENRDSRGREDEEERIVPSRADPTASVRTGLAMTGDERLESRESRIEEREAAESPDPDSQNSNLKTQNSSAAALRQRAAEHLDSLRRQAEALREEFPDFDLDAALRDPDFLRLTAPGLGVDLRRAYYALHREDLDSRAARRAAEETRRRLARSLASGGLRPREGGGQEAAAALASDYRSLSRPQQLQLKQRIIEAAARGEKIYP